MWRLGGWDENFPHDIDFADVGNHTLTTSALEQWFSALTAASKAFKKSTAQVPPLLIESKFPMLSPGVFLSSPKYTLT